MAYQITLTMSSAYTGTTEADNFTIIGKHCNGSPTDTVIATNVTKQDLINGVTYQVADTITGGTVTSTGTCTNSVNWLGLNNCGGDTPSPTPNPTPTSGDLTTNYQFDKCNNVNGESPQNVVISEQDWSASGGLGQPQPGDHITVEPGNSAYQGTVYSFSRVTTNSVTVGIDSIGGTCDGEL